MNKVVAVLKAIRRARVPIIIVVATLIALATAFMTTKGIVVGDALEQTKIEYGNEPTFSASAIFSDVRYEFCKASGGEWSSTPPTRMGEYKVRAVSNGVFGERYGDEQRFSIVARRVEVSIKGNTVTYGENPDVEANLAFKDRVLCSEFVFADTTQPVTAVTPVKDKIVVLDENGKDVTGNYIITPKTSQVAFTKRDITVTVDSTEKVYDGTALTLNTWKETAGSLVYGDRIIMVEGTQSTIIGAGQVSNTCQMKIVRGNVDVTFQYNLTQVAGTLTITQKPITVYPNGGEYVYDGKTHYDLGFTVDPSTPLVGGHTISASKEEYPSITNVGETENYLQFIILNGEDSDVTDNYCFTYAGDYMLKITSREVSVKTESGSAVYDGCDHTYEGVELTGEGTLAEGHSFYVVEATKIKNVGKYENVLTVGVKDQNGNDVTDNYIILSESGALEVIQRDITITSDSLNGIYNGKAQGANTVTSGDGELCEGHTIQAEFENTVTDCKTVVDNRFSAVILDENGQDVTLNYNPTYVFGVMELSPLTVYVETVSMTYTYDGKEHEGGGVSYSYGSNQIIDGHSFVFVGAPVIKNVSSVTNSFEIRVLEGEADKTFNYDIICQSYGTLAIIKRELVVTAGSLDKTYYDGVAVENPGYTLSGEGVAPGQREEIVVEAEDYVNAGTYINTVTSIIIYDENSTPVTDNYSITSLSGIISIGRRPVLITSNSFADKVYFDGEMHREETYTLATSAEGDPIVAGQYIKVSFPYSSYVQYVTEPKTNYFNIDGVFVEGTNEDVTANYTFSSIYGELRLEKRPVMLVSDSIPENTVVYDGYEHTLESFTDDTVRGMGVVAGHKVHAVYSGSITDAGEAVNSFYVLGISDRYGRDMTPNYEISTENGTLRVYPRPIVLTSQSATQVYNATYLTNEDVLIGGMGAAPGQRVVFSNFAAIIGVGTMQNTFNFEFQWDNGRNVKATNYDVTTVYDGLLEVTKRPLTVTVESISQIYNGYELKPSENGYIVEIYDGLSGERGLLPQHSFLMELYGGRLLVGTDVIGYKNIMITSSDTTPDVIDGGVTYNYDITVIDGTLTVTERDISLKAPDLEKEYDGEALKAGNTVIVGELGLAETDTIEVTLSGSQTDAGTSTSRIESFKIYNGNTDVTSCYNVTEMLDGALTVTRRQIVITINDGYKEFYDGGAVVSGGFTVDRLLEHLGHALDIEIVGQQINVGFSVATYVDGSVTIVDGEGESVLHNYDFSVVDGRLTVEKKRPITITSASDRFIFDGKEHKNESYTVGGMGLATEREEYEVVTFTNEVMIKAGEYENRFTALIYVKGTNEDVTSNYEITYEFGTVTIEKVKINIVTGGGTKVFDATPLTNGEILATSINLPSGYRIEAAANGTITYVGKVTNGYSLTVYDGEGNVADISNFELIEELGTLEITPIMLTVTSNDGSKTYDGAPLTEKGYTSNWDETEAAKKGLVNLVVTVNGSRTDVGRSKNLFIVGIYDKDGNAVDPENYAVDAVYGSLTVYAPPIKATSNSSLGVYTGFEYDVRYAEYEGYVSSKHRVSIKLDGEIINVGEHENLFTLEIVDGDGNSVMEFYPDITYEYGTITVEKRDITIAAPNLKEKYTGEPLYAPSDIVVPNRDLDSLNSMGDNYVYTYSVDDMSDVFITRPGQTMYYTIPAERFHIYLNGEELEMSNFNVTCEEGKLTLSEKLVEINVYKIVKAYSGKLVSYREDDWYLTDGQLPSGYTLDLRLEGGLTDVGVIDFEELLEELLANGRIHVYDENGDDVTESFDFKFVGTPLTVTARALQITAASAEKHYDGKELKAEEYSITGGSLARGHSIKKCVVLGSITDVGESSNIVSTVIIVDANGVDVTDNYDIDKVYGTLKIIEE